MKRILFIISIIFLISAGSLHAESKKGKEKKYSPPPLPVSQYEKLKVKFFRLRNIDPEVTKLEEWKSSVNELSAFAKNNPTDIEAPHALINAAALNEQIFLKKGERSFIKDAQDNLKAIYSSYPNTQLADDALMKLAEIENKYFEDPDAAGQYYNLIVQNYKNSEMYEVAKLKLHLANPDREEDASSDKEDDDGDDDEEVNDEKSSKVIVIDPGHGGEDEGAVGYGGLMEKDVTLDVALTLEKILKKDFQSVYLTRNKDKFIPLSERTTYANGVNGDIFISLHLNASPAKTLSGIEAFYLDNTEDRASKTLADRENDSVRFEGAEADLQYMLSDLIQNTKIEESVKLATKVKGGIIRNITQNKFQLRDLGVKKAPFYVLVGAHMPCVLVEMSFIDHAEEGMRLSTKEYRNTLAQGIAEGIKDFLITKQP